MGNLPSQVVAEDELGDLELEKAAQKGDIQETGENLFDFSILFNTEALHKALVSVKDVQVSEIQKKKSEIEQWLKNLTDRGEKTVGIAQFVDFLTSKNIDRDEAVQFFNELDPDGEGNIEITFILQMIMDKKGPDLKEALIPCHLLPGSIDTYLTEKNNSNLGNDIIKFLRRHRVESSYLSSVTVNQIIGVLESRERLVNGRYYSLQEKKKDGLLLEEDEGDDAETQEKVLVTKCYSNVTVSSNERTVGNLTDNSMETYWQSNGSPRSHWIRIQMLPGVRLKEFSVALSTSDDSYMPKTFTVCVGNLPSNLKEIRQYSVPREHSGKFSLLGSLKAEYRYIQVNIRGCHSDGCDTRIRHVYVKGYRYKKEEEPTVTDGLVMWYLSLIASVAKAAMPLSSTLRENILTQSKMALQYMPPLSLSKTSPRKPEFLSPILIVEIDKFIKTLCLPGENFVSIDVEAMSVLLGFSLTTGNLNNVLDALQILMDNAALELPVHSLMQKMATLEEQKFRMHAPTMKVSVVKCDVETEEGHMVGNMFTNELTGSGVPFKTVKGKKVVNVIIKGEEKENGLLQLVKIHMKVTSGDTAARACLLFSLDCDNLEGDSVLQNYTKFDDWTIDNWNCLEDDNTSDVKPLAYLEPEKESREVEMSINCNAPTKYLLIKLLAQESSEQISVQCLKIRGYQLIPQQKKNRDFLQNMVELCPLPVDSALPMEGTKVLLRSLVFLCRMLQDLGIIHAQRTAAMLDPENFEEGHISTENLSLEKIWNLYIPLTLSSEGFMEQSGLLCLLLLRYTIPFLKATPPKENTSEQSSVASAVLSHLCSLMDNPNTDPFIHSLTQDIIKDGVVVFFPGSKARKKYLLEMIELVTGEQPPSWWLKFEALCGHFSKTNNNSLLELPWDSTKVLDMDIDHVLSIFSTVIGVATKEAYNDLQEGARAHPDNLVRLLCAMQSNMLFWIRHQLSSGKELKEEQWTKIKETMHDLLKQYVSKVFDSCYDLLIKLESLEELKECLLDVLKKSIVGQTLPELLTFLGSLVLEDIPITSLLNKFQRLVILLHSLSKKIPQIFLNLASKQLEHEEDCVLAVWTRESPHNYENNSKITEEFVCPGTDKFVVEFDSRCRTERRYDYLQFTDVSGEKKTFDDVYGSDHWAATAEFKGPKLSFYFYSDGSNNYWGYKFTIKAYGKGFPPLHWLFDLHICLSRVIGLYVSAVLGARTDVGSFKCANEEERKEMDALLRSDLWKTLLRGGFQVGKLTRSLSGAYATNPTDSDVCSYLCEMANEEDQLPPLVELCRAAKGGPFFGGPLVDKAITAVFAALIWHSQELREELGNQLTSPKATLGLLDAFSAAEALRRELVEARQKLMEIKEGEENKEDNAKINEDLPVITCHEKAVYLLKFAGLSRITAASHGDERPSSPIIRRPSWGQKSWRWQKVSSVVSTVSRIKQQVSREGRPLSLAEKHPSFDTVLSFLRNSVLTRERVNSLLQDRSQLARDISEVFNIAAEFLRNMNSRESVEIPVLVFLQHLLSHQRKFPLHYGLRLDGCGLELETRLRRSFQLFMHRLLETIRAHKKILENISIETGQEEALQVIRCIFSHMLDLSWQDYDHLLLHDMQLPEYLFETTINSSAAEEKIPVFSFEGEEKMLEQYQQLMKFLEQWKTIEDKEEQFTKFKNSELGQENTKETLIFLSALLCNKELSGTTPLCDGCKMVLDNENKSWYRNIDIDEDLNLCKECFFDGTGSRPDTHSLEHTFQQFGTHQCSGCGLSITSHRFLNQSDSTNYCIGCFRKESSPTIKWTVYLLKEEPATATTNKFLTHDDAYVQGILYCNGNITKYREASDAVFYNQQHSWMLFSSLALSMAHKLSDDKKKKDADPTYQRYACDLLLNCLQLIATGLKFSLAAALDEEQRKEKEKLKPTEEKEKDEAATEEDKPTTQTIEIEEEEEQEGNLDPRVQTDSPMDSTTNKAPATTSTGTKESGATPTATEESEATPTATKESETTPTATKESEATPTPTKEPEATPTTTKESEAKDVEIKSTDTEGSEVILTTKDTETTPIDAAESNATEKQNTSEATPTTKVADSTAPTVDILPPVCDPSESYLGRPLTGPERSFGLQYVDKLLGLLATVLPKELSLQSWITLSGSVERVIADEVLPVLLQLARTSAIGETRQLQSVLVATQYMARVSTEVADRAIEVLNDAATDDEREKTHGNKTSDYLFELGAAHLKKSNISGAAAVAECLILLSRSMEWKGTVAMTIGGVLEKPPELLDLSGIFGLLVTAGFPKLLRVGSVVKWTKNESNDELKGVIVSAPSPEETQINVVDLKSREPCTIKQSDVEVEETLKGCIVDSRLPQLLTLLSNSFKSVAKKDSSYLVETHWICSLALKALNVLLNTNVSGIINSVLQANILSDIIKLSCKPTQLNSQWTLSDLEILGISCYKPASERAIEESGDTTPTSDEIKGTDEVDGSDNLMTKENTKDDKKSDKDDKKSDDEEEVKSKIPPKEDKEIDKEEKVEPTPLPPPKTQQQIEEETAFRDLDDEVKNTLMIFKEAFLCSPSIIRAIYEFVEHNMEKLIESSERFYDQEGSCLNVSDEIKEEAKKWKPFQRSTSVKETIQEYQDSQEDMGVTGFISVNVDLKKVTATSENEDDLKKGMVLIPKEKDKKKAKEGGEREKSHDLLREQLIKFKEEVCDQKTMLKVNKALMVLHSRQVLGSLLAQWPNDGPLINALLMGGLDTSRWFSLLDFLIKGLPQEKQEKLLRNVILYSESTELVSLALTAAQCMTEVAVAMETKEFKYPREGEGKFEGKITLANAAFLNVTMETKRTLHGTIEFASDNDFTQYHYHHSQNENLTKEEKEEEQEHKIPGNTAHYRIQLNKQEDKSHYHVWSFKVVGLQMGKFNTSYSLLRILLGDPSDLTTSGTPPISSLPVITLWPKLIAAACELTGDQRLKVVGLLLQLLHLNSSRMEGEATATSSSPRLDLTLLKPLWSLYTSMTKTEDKPEKIGNLKPEIVRALTELFLIVENLAQEWGVEQDLMVETISEECLMNWFEKGVSNVALVSIGSGLTNRLSEIFTEAKKNYVPPPSLPSPASVGSRSRSRSLQSSSSSSSSTSDHDSGSSDSDSS